jgi:DNA-binding protein Fis
MQKTLDTHTIADIHQIIRKSQTLQEAASKLKVSSRVLKRYLDKFNYIDTRLNFEFLQDLSEEMAQLYWQEAYNKPMKVRALSLDKCTFAQMHQQIRDAASLRSLAADFGVSDLTLEIHLAKFQINNQPMTFQLLQSFDEHEFQILMGAQYQQLMKSKIVKLCTYTIAQIHQQVIETNSLSKAAMQLGVASKTLKLNLEKFNYKNTSLTYEIFKELSIEEAQAYWTEAYHQPMVPLKKNISDYKLAYVHELTLKTENILSTANLLGVPSTTLERCLSKFNYEHEVLTFDTLKSISKENAQRHWGEDYQQFLVQERVNLKKLSFQFIHHHILQAKSCKQAAKALGVTHAGLEKHLGKERYLEKPLSFAQLKEITAEQAQNIWQAQYLQPMNTKKIALKNLPLATIHQRIKQASSGTQAAAKLGVNIKTLKIYLAGFFYNNLPLDIKTLQKLSFEEAKDYWSELYEKPSLRVKIDINKYTIAKIHEAILNTNNITEATALLGIPHTTLSSHLAKFCIEGQPISYELMKSFSIEIAQFLWGEAYNKPMDARINLNNCAFSFIHEQILKANDMKQASSFLGVTPLTLMAYLGRIIIENEPLTFERLNQMSIESAKGLLGELYNQSIQTKTPKSNKFTLAYIHKQILKANNNTEACALLGLSSGYIYFHLGNIIYNEEPVTPELLKRMSVQKAQKIWGNAYYLTLEEIKQISTTISNNCRADSNAPPARKRPRLSAPQYGGFFWHVEQDEATTQISEQEKTTMEITEQQLDEILNEIQMDIPM